VQPVIPLFSSLTQSALPAIKVNKFTWGDILKYVAYVLLIYPNSMAGLPPYVLEKP